VFGKIICKEKYIDPRFSCIYLANVFLGQVLYRLYLCFHCFVQVYITIVIDILTKVEYLYISMQRLTDNCYNDILICYIVTSVFLLSFGILFIGRLVVVYCSIYRF